MLKKGILGLILLFSLVCGGENETSFPQQSKPLILAKNRKNLTKRRKHKKYSRRKKRTKSVISLKRRQKVRKNLLLSVHEYKRLSHPIHRMYIKEIRRAYLQFEQRSGYNKLQKFSRKRRKQALLFLSPLLISYSEAAAASSKCLIGGVLRDQTASGECSTSGRSCNGSSDNFKCGGIFSGACVPIQPVKRLSKRCYDYSKDIALSAADYKNWKNLFDNTIQAYCENQKKAALDCEAFKDRLDQIKEKIKEESNDTTEASSIKSKADLTEARGEDTKTEATAPCTDCGGGNGRASDQASQFASLQEVGEALKKASATNNLKFLPVCERTKQIKEEIERLLNKSCKDITKDDLLKITSLDLKRKRIKSLKSGDFSGLVNLKELDLSSNYIDELPPELFYDLKELTKLALQGAFEIGHHTSNLEWKSKSRRMDKDQFKYNTKLTELNLSFNDLTHLPENLFKHNTQLTELNLSLNDLKSLHKDQFRYNTQLTELDLNASHLDGLHKDQFINNKELTKLDLSLNYNIKSLDKDQFMNNKELTELNLYSIGLDNLDQDQFIHNTKLTELNLSSNDLTHLPENLFKHNTELTKLDLGFAFDTGHGAALKDIPSKLFHPLKKLTHLEFVVPTGHLPEDLLKNNTQLENLDIYSYDSWERKTIPESLLANATNLEKFTFQSSGHVTLPEKLFEKNTNLTHINLEAVNIPENLLTTNTKLTYISIDDAVNIPENLLTTNTKLKFFDLESRNIKKLPEKLFENNPYLKTVFINTALSSVPTKTLANAQGLKDVTLQSRGIRSLSGDDFKGSEQLTSVHVSADNLSEVDEKVLAPLSKLRNFSLKSDNLPTLPDNLLKENSELRGLDLHVDNVTSLDKDFIASNGKLKGLSLKAAKVETLPKGFFRNTHEVRGMTFEDNKSFKAFHPDAFKSMTRLQNLEMINNPQMQSFPDLTHTDLNKIKVAGNNSLSHVPGEWLNKGIREVEFSGNQGVRSFSKDALKGLTELRKISITDHSLLGDIPSGTFSGLNLQYVTFAGNPLLTGERKTRIIDELKTEYPDLILTWDGAVQRW